MFLFGESQADLLQNMNDSRSACTVNVIQFLHHSLLNGRCYIGAILLHKRSLHILPQLRHPFLMEFLLSPLHEIYHCGHGFDLVKYPLLVVGQRLLYDLPLIRQDIQLPEVLYQLFRFLP